MQSKATSVAQYLAELPADRREAIEAVRAVILKNLGKGFEEGMQYGMIGYCVPHSIYPAGYHCDPRQPLPFAALASQKNYMSLYLMCIYGMPEHLEWFQKAWAKTGKKLDMGKGCVRFKKLEDVALEVVGQAIKRVPVKEFVEHYESVRPGGPKPGAGAKGPAGSAAPAEKSKGPAGKATKKSAKKTGKASAKRGGGRKRA